MEPVETQDVVANILAVMRLYAAQHYAELGARTFRYSDLPEKSKDVVRASWREGSHFDDWDSKHISEAFYERLSELGYCSKYVMGDPKPSGLELHFSLGYCQGDGVAFEGTPDDIVAIAKRLLSYNDYRLLNYVHRGDNNLCGSLFGYLSVTVNHRGHYYHKNSFTVDVSDDCSWYRDDLTERQTSTIERLEECIQDELEDLSSELEKVGYDIIEYRDSDECVDDSIESNWCNERFFVDGTRVEL